MTITVTSIDQGPFTATGLAQTVAYTFMTLTDEEISVFYDAGAGRILVDPAAHVVTRNKNIDGSAKEGGSVELAVAAVPSGSSIYLRANPRADRDLVWSDTGSRLKNLNEEQDRMILRLLATNDTLSRNIDGMAEAGSAAGAIAGANAANAVVDSKADSTGENFTPTDQVSFLDKAGAETLFNQNSVLAYIPVNLWAGIAAQTSTADVTAYVQAAVDTGKDIVFPAGRYLVNQIVLNTPRQRLICLSWDTLIRQINTGTPAARPLLIFNTGAIAATVDGGTWDHNAAACVNPTIAGGDIATGSAVLMMADYCRMINSQVLNGWDNGISLYRVNLETGGFEAGKPVAPVVAFARTENCGCGTRAYGGLPAHQAGSGVNNLSASAALVVGCVDFSSRTNFIADYGAGAGGTFRDCTGYFAKISTGETGFGGFGVYSGTGDYRWENIQIIECQGDGVWIDGYSQNVRGDFYVKAAARRGALIQGKNVQVHVTANACSFGNSGVYDAIEVRGNADTGGGVWGNSTGIELIEPSVYGTEHRYALSVIDEGGRKVSGMSSSGFLEAGTVGIINNTQVGFVIDGISQSNLGGFVLTYGRRSVRRACSSYITQLFGDFEGNGALFVESGANSDKRLAMGYDDTNDVGVIQSIQAGAAKKGLLLNPSGGLVQAGKGSWDQGPLLLGSYYLWVDPVGKLRIKNSAPTFGEDGTVVGTQT